MLKNKDYSRNIALQCVVCGDTESFTNNEDESYIICNRCGREYLGGKDELIKLNKQLIDTKIDEMKAEVTKDLQTELNKKIKSIFK